MKMCPTCEVPICNHCKHLTEVKRFSVYTCALTNQEIDRADWCNDFECTNYVEPIPKEVNCGV